MRWIRFSNLQRNGPLARCGQKVASGIHRSPSVWSIRCNRRRQVQDRVTRGCLPHAANAGVHFTSHRRNLKSFEANATLRVLRARDVPSRAPDGTSLGHASSGYSTFLGIVSAQIAACRLPHAWLSEVLRRAQPHQSPAVGAPLPVRREYPLDPKGVHRFGRMASPAVLQEPHRFQTGAMARTATNGEVWIEAGEPRVPTLMPALHP